MSNRVPQSFIDELLAAVDIVAVVKSRLPLLQEGKSFKGRCPFHDDESHSLIVSPETQQYHCPTCEKEGSAIGFVMYHDKLHFFEAVKLLSEQYQLNLDGVVSNRVIEEPTRRLLSLMQEVTHYYSEQLIKNS